MSRGLKIMTIIVIIITLMAIASVTYAWLSWSKDISLSSSSKCFDIAYSKGADITGDLLPVDTPISDGYFTYKGGMAFSTFTIKMNNSCTTPGDFILTLKNINVPSTYINGDSRGALKYVLVYAPNVTIDSSYYVFAQGSINTTDDITIYTGGITNDYNRTYTLIVYVDGNLAFDDAIGSSYIGYVMVNAVQKTSYDISGSLLDSSDNILSGYTITVDNEITSTTDESGNYTLSSVPFGEHSIIVKDSSNNVITNSTFTLESSNNNSSNSSTIFIGSNRVQTLNIKLGSDNTISSYEWSRLGNSVLPIEYQEVEYLESSGTQYIDTEYKANGNTQYYFKYKDCMINGVMFGAYNSSWEQGYGYYINVTKDNYNPFIHYFSNTRILTGYHKNGEVFIDKGNVSIDNINYVSSESKTFSLNYSTYIFAGNMKNSIEQRTKYKLFYFIISEDNINVRYFIPVLRISDLKPGMYDTVTGTFFVNSGTGEFGYETLDGVYISPV